ncbi:hypothetical protein LGM35_07810 [Burkholderia cenocepacia]|uniref:hypothetical protein n=1 Tax=Burkholderia cenocepacia TaxID=95486 RepID=UPI001CF1BA72|nr:hypothetical protein [Burkholderia cenocepacia]MCA7922389.1 hypothetical protein [Burkholderia cenocepacia]
MNIASETAIVPMTSRPPDSGAWGDGDDMVFLRDERRGASAGSRRARACDAWAGEPRCGRFYARRAVQAVNRIGEAVTGFVTRAGRSGRRDARDASAASAQVAAVACVVIFHRHRLTMRRAAINARMLINSFPALQ